MSSKWLQTVTCIFAFYAKFGRCAVFSQKQCDGGWYIKMVKRDISQGTNPTLIWGRLRPFFLLKKTHFCKVHFCILRKIRSLRSFFLKKCDGGWYIKMVRKGISQGTNPTPIWRRLRLISALKLAHNGKMHFYDLSKIRSLRSFFSKTMRWRVMLRIEIERHGPWEESHTIFDTCFLIFDCQINHQGEN